MASLTALSKTYSTLRNVPLPNTGSYDLTVKSFLWTLKECLLGVRTNGGSQGGTRTDASKWTIVKSCDGVSVGTGTDLWGTTFDPSKLVYANPGTAHSWFWLRNTALGHDFIIDWNSDPGQGSYLCRFAIVKVTESTSFGNGTVSVGPTAITGGVQNGYESSNSLWKANGSGNVGASQNFGILSSAGDLWGNQCYMHYTTNSADGAFWALLSAPGIGRFNVAISVVKTDNVPVSDTWNTFLVCSRYSSGRGALRRGATGNGNEGSLVHNTTVFGRCSTGLVMVQGGFGPDIKFADYPYVSAASADSSTGQYTAWPVDIATISPQYAMRGRVPDMYTVTQLPVGSCIPSSDSNCQRVVVGDCILPFVGGAPII